MASQFQPLASRVHDTDPGIIRRSITGPQRLVKAAHTMRKQLGELAISLEDTIELEAVTPPPVMPTASQPSGLLIHKYPIIHEVPATINLSMAAYNALSKFGSSPAYMYIDDNLYKQACAETYAVYRIPFNGDFYFLGPYYVKFHSRVINAGACDIPLPAGYIISHHEDSR